MSIPEYDPTLDPNIINIFNPADQWVPRNVTLKTADRSPAIVEPKSSTPTANNPTSNLYCTACKKKFNNEATWQNHLKSAKHIANAKTKSKQQQQKQQQPSGSKATSSNVDPQVADALKNLQRASANPSTSVPMLWSLSKVFYSHRRPQHTYQSLQLVVDTLQSSEPPTGLTPSQISSTLYISRLALARLLCLYPSSTTADKKDLALNALNDKWKVDKSQLLSLAKTCTSITMENMMQACRQLASRFVAREEARTEPAKPKVDQNQCFTKILIEMATNIFGDDTRIRIVLLCLACVVCHFEGINSYEWMVHLAQLYESISAKHCASELHVICHDKLLDKNNIEVQRLWWHLFMALLLALETDDIVRADAILAMIQEDSKATQYEDIQVRKGNPKRGKMMIHMRGTHMMES
ncbi:hypothetical protein LRAMOSA07394 [Lichtheimia ramosa]|uniref:C2H2-type domain-containing protein n=1 Tax=Lichtheimia ramosa TaxID=688394 RepID=A0A077WCI3_9FUNG|nr:hypothetical protein LRAMOSA07394 [Lichtheimia ramosa]